MYVIKQSKNNPHKKDMQYGCHCNCQTTAIIIIIPVVLIPGIIILLPEDGLLLLYYYSIINSSFQIRIEKGGVAIITKQKKFS